MQLHTFWPAALPHLVFFFFQKSKTNHVISVSSNSSKAQSAYMAGQLHSCSAFLVEVERRVILELLSSPSPSLSLSAHGESDYGCSLSFSLSALGTLWLLSLSLTFGTTGLSTLGTGREWLLRLATLITISLSCDSTWHSWPQWNADVQHRM